MPVSTVCIHDPVDYKAVFARCRELVGAPEGIKTGEASGWVSIGPDQGLYAWAWVEYGHDRPPLRTTRARHRERCEPGCGYQHAPGCWIDTGDGYHDHGRPRRRAGRP